MDDSRQELFKVLVPSSGHKYVIYTNGDTEGFPENDKVLIFNYYRALLARARAQEQTALRREIENLRAGQPLMT
jgi:hypothetical protein